MRRIDEIIIHCSATKEGANFHASDIDKWHKAKGWKGIGYHYVIDIDGKLEFGRPLADEGAHTVGHNKYSIGICYIGGLDNKGNAKDTRTYAQKVTLYNLLFHLKQLYPDARIGVHNEFATNKKCPCFSREQLINEVNSWYKLQKLTEKCNFK